MQQQLATYIRNTTGPISDAELDTVLSHFKTRSVRKNEYLVKAGQTSQRMFFVAQGCLRIFFVTTEQEDATRHIAFENSFATALSSFISGRPSEEYIQALEPSELFSISHGDFYTLLTVVPAWANFHRHYLEMAYVNNTQRLMSFLTLDAASRYRQLLDQNPVVVQRLSNKIVASYLNMSQETLSRVKSRR